MKTKKTSAGLKTHHATLDALLWAWLDSIIDGTKEQERAAYEAYRAYTQ